MDVSALIRQRLTELGSEQKELAKAAQVTESYISQLLTRKRPPPAPNRTDIYSKMDDFLKLPPGELARVVELQRREELKRVVGDEPGPLFKEVRALILAKCRPNTRKEIAGIFDQQPYGELERLITQTLLDVVKRVAREELENEDWLRTTAELSGRSYQEMRVVVLEFLDTDTFHLSREDWVTFLEPLIAYWDIELATFELEIALDPRLTSQPVKYYRFTETRPPEPGLDEFLQDAALSGTATEAEVEFLKGLRFSNQRPTPLYYYRELQSLRDPLHFRAARAPGTPGASRTDGPTGRRAGNHG